MSEKTIEERLAALEKWATEMDDWLHQANDIFQSPTPPLNGFGWGWALGKWYATKRFAWSKE